MRTEKMTDQNLAFLFPGQGSQSVGMLDDLAASHAEVIQTFNEASDSLGMDLWHLISAGSAASLNLTENTQPVMLVAGVACYRVWTKLSNITPAWGAGHSLGEYTALVCADAIDLGDAAKLVRERARLMQDAVPSGDGAMAAILGLEDADVKAICAAVTRADHVVFPANYNAPGQVVVAGHALAVTEAIELAKTRGAKRAVSLPVSVPSHCPLMDSAAREFSLLLDSVEIRQPRFALVHNFDAGLHTGAEAIRQALAKQMCNAVLWATSISFLSGQSVNRFVECGPGKVLAGLNRRIVPDCATGELGTSKSVEKVLGWFA